MHSIRHLEFRDFERVHEINEANVPEVGSVDVERLRFLIEQSTIALVVEVGTDAGGAIDADADTGSDVSADTGGNTNADTGGNTNADTGGNTNADTGGNTNADTGGNTNADTGGNTSADTGGNASADTGSNVVGFCLVIPPGSSYDSSNYRWFMERYDDGWYLDRVALDASATGKGLGTALYAAVEDALRAHGVARLLLEVNSDPPNPTSLAFHARRGFRELTRRMTPYGIEVAMLERVVSDGRP